MFVVFGIRRLAASDRESAQNLIQKWLQERYARRDDDSAALDTCPHGEIACVPGEVWATQALERCGLVEGRDRSDDTSAKGDAEAEFLLPAKLQRDQDRSGVNGEVEIDAAGKCLEKVSKVSECHFIPK